MLQAIRSDTDFFREHGYVILERVISEATVADLRAFLQSAIDDALSQLSSEIGIDSHNIPGCVRQLESEGKLAGVSQKAKSILTGHFPLETRLSERLWGVPKSPLLRSALEEILGTKCMFMHMPPAARFVLPGNVHAAVPAHQDITYGSHMSDFVTVWVPFVDIDADCGGLAVFDRSSLRPTIDVPNDGEAFWLPPVDVSGYRRVECKTRLGDVIVLNKHLIHESIPNRSDRIRLSADFRFFADGQTSSKHHLDMQNWTVIAPS